MMNRKLDIGNECSNILTQTFQMTCFPWGGGKAAGREGEA